MLFNSRTGLEGYEINYIVQVMKTDDNSFFMFFVDDNKHTYILRPTFELNYPNKEGFYTVKSTGILSLVWNAERHCYLVYSFGKLIYKPVPTEYAVELIKQGKLYRGE